uniref:PAM2 domain-containing protein n=1 Tax=Ascaris lumbricoides TaxID=6252 RepID=A0A0M3HLB1_ASCLU
MENAQSSTVDNALTSKSSNMPSKPAVTTITLEPSAQNLQYADELHGVQPGLPFFYERNEEGWNS